MGIFKSADDKFIGIPCVYLAKYIEDYGFKSDEAPKSKKYVSGTKIG